MRLPVRTALLQNYIGVGKEIQIVRLPVRTALLQNVKCDKGKTKTVRLPVRTALLQNPDESIAKVYVCDYQSERHCSKTRQDSRDARLGAITSQNGTAPKLPDDPVLVALSAITSQNGTAPKPSLCCCPCSRCAITSQNGTAPKPGDIQCHV